MYIYLYTFPKLCIHNTRVFEKEVWGGEICKFKINRQVPEVRSSKLDRSSTLSKWLAPSISKSDNPLISLSLWNRPYNLITPAHSRVTPSSRICLPWESVASVPDVMRSHERDALFFHVARDCAEINRARSYARREHNFCV